ncbi:putative Zn-dependent protease [Sphingomonas insulae]|uniref:Peptidase M48 domain-containing protein n=1 Tax=Sphingomonas insulae TaxID=424800 RepID=A0ABP3SX64_9SPHN|nr:M48 family metallopeptidase [Sphingomonas insulae]NIJ29198.1 putative Zn-dependent protease [Sphingomonas insulae]
MRWRIAAALTIGMASTPAMAANKVAPLPPYVAAYQPTNVDERGAWMMADEDERHLRDAADVIRDPALNAYVRGVLCRTVGEDRCKSVRLYILRVPAFNATMTANGTMTIWSGALLRLRNEAELGAVLGHEFGHFELRHTLSSFRNRRSGSDLMAWASILVANSGAMQISTIGGFYAFDRAQETSADMIGVRYLATSRYPSAAAADVWDRIMGEADATAIGRHRKANQKYVAGFFATHPTNLARATYLRAAAQEIGDGGSAAADAYRAALAPWLPTFLADQVKLNDFGGSEFVLAQLAADGWTTPLLFARAELYRERGNPRDLVSAAGFYQDAIARGDAPPEAYRGLGLSLLRSQQIEPGKVALRDYLRRKPDAGDAALISTLVDS